MVQIFNHNVPEPLKVLFVDVNEEDTSFLTKDVPVAVTLVSKSNMELHLAHEHFDALVMNVGNSGTETIRTLKESHETAVFMLADSSEVARAIDFVKQGADGFFLRGISNPDSFEQMTKFANRSYQPGSRE